MPGQAQYRAKTRRGRLRTEAQAEALVRLLRATEPWTLHAATARALMRRGLARKAVPADYEGTVWVTRMGLRSGELPPWTAYVPTPLGRRYFKRCAEKGVNMVTS
jgi:hypothetical protein